MGRKTTRETLKKIVTGKGEAIDKLVREILYKIYKGDCVMNQQEEYEDDEFSYKEFYGEFDQIGVTSRQKKKLEGNNSHYFLLVETEDCVITVSATAAAKAWNLTLNQIKNHSQKVDEKHINDICNQLGIS